MNGWTEDKNERQRMMDQDTMQRKAARRSAEAEKLEEIDNRASIERERMCED